MKKKEPSGSLHPRNLHQGEYDFGILCLTVPELAAHVFENKFGTPTLNFADPESVKLLNKALLIRYYGLRYWDIPAGFLCPPIPGRADYIHHAADLLAASNAGKNPGGNKIAVLDIGTGANLVYPILGNASYGWRFIGSELNPFALDSAKTIISENPHLVNQIRIVSQTNPQHIFQDIVQVDSFFDLTVCNPPFHESKEVATVGSMRKVKNLTGKRTAEAKLNFGGQSTELWCEGGELGFIQRMIAESLQYRSQVFWFTTLVSKSENLKPLEASLRKAGVFQFKVVPMAQGNKQSRFIAWTFLDLAQQTTWRQSRWA